MGNGDWDYLGFTNFIDLPSILNPKKNYIVSSNQRVSPKGYDIFFTNDWEV
jgi:acyl-homoserine lactone acylase PvdQ